MNNMNSVQLIKVTQWLKSWEKAHWDEEKGLAKPRDHFFVGSMPISELRSLAGVTHRSIEQRKDPNAIAGYQRAHEEVRSRKINRYLQYGYPLSTTASLDPMEHEELINPGWLPNAIIINIIPPHSIRYKEGKVCSVPADLEVKVETSGQSHTLSYPSCDKIKEFKRGGRGSYLEPIEVIDGQHRLYAIDSQFKMEGQYEVPVVIFVDLSLAWQAYLFWTINVEPKKINPSLAFDLYPELRRQEWLDKSEAIKIYQEHRSQEMTEILWSHVKSPWKDRIELFGNRVKGHVSNASFIRSLNRSFIKKWAKGDRVGGLFGSIALQGSSTDRVIPWQRSQQAAFLILIWTAVHSAIIKSRASWISALVEVSEKESESKLSPAFCGEHTLLATDQGVQAIHGIFNAIFQDSPDVFSLESWHVSAPSGPSITSEEIDEAITLFKRLGKASAALDEISSAIVEHFDWRLSSAPGLTQEEVQMQSAYRGSSGYTLIVGKLIRVLTENCRSSEIVEISKRVSLYLGKKG